MFPIPCSGCGLGWFFGLGWFAVAVVLGVGDLFSKSMLKWWGKYGYACWEDKFASPSFVSMNGITVEISLSRN
jgi:hypothetical protein